MSLQIQILHPREVPCEVRKDRAPDVHDAHQPGGPSYAWYYTHTFFHYIFFGYSLTLDPALLLCCQVVLQRVFLSLNYFRLDSYSRSCMIAVLQVCASAGLVL
jgi:hypothetical protein